MASAPRMPAGLKEPSHSKISEIPTSSLREDIPSRVDASFALRYICQDPVPPAAVDWEAYSGPCVFNIQTAPSERRMYEPLRAILTKMSLTVHKELSIQGPRLIFQDSHARKPSSIPGYGYMPGIRCIELTGEGAPPLAAPQQTSWLEIVSFVEVKKSQDAVWQAAFYAHVAPTARPDIAGMLYLTVSRRSVQLHWSDAFGIVSSPQYKWCSPETPRVIFNYIRTLYQPLPDRPHSDKTITKAQDFDKDGPRWNFRVGNMTYTCEILFSAPAHGRQTCIARTTGEGPVRVIKDTWHDTRRCFTEAALIEKIHSQGTVPGVIRLESSALVMDSSNQPLRTSAQHFGDGSGQPSSWVPREKVRNVFASTGKPLEERKSVLQLLKALYDVVEAHRVCLSRGVLHRDLSIYNILIEPKHSNDTQNTLAKDATYIEQVLNPQSADVKEQGLIIDFDNAVALGESDPDSKANCIGTPMFIAEAVAQGGWFEEDFLRPLPSLSGRALELYKKAYGGYRYAEYSSATERAKLKPAPLPPFEHQGYHDMESIFWILVWEFLCAWPEGAEPELSPAFERAYDIMANHTFDDIEDSRSPLRNSRAGYAVTWGARVHPRLHPLLPMLHQMDLFLRTEWYWVDNLPVDHCHEAMRRLLLGEIVWMEEQGDEIPLRRERRRPPCREDTTRCRSLPVKGIKRGASV